MTTTKITKPQLALLAEIATAGPDGMTVPGTKGSTARVLREDHHLTEDVPPSPATCWCGKCPVKKGVARTEIACVSPERSAPRQRATAAGIALVAGRKGST
jgi:hypothetical protein